MGSIIYGIQPQDWIRAQRNVANDGSIYGYIKYIGDEESGLVDCANTTGDLTFNHGDAGSEAADSGIGTAGVIDLSALRTGNAQVRDLNVAINVSDNWQFIPKDFRPEDEIEYGDGTASIAEINTTDNDCTVELGFPLTEDTSTLTNEILCAGVTLNGPLTKVHAHDRQVLHEILEIQALIDWGTTSDEFYIYSCNDWDHESEKIGELTLADNTATVFDNNGEPMYAAKGRRLVVRAKGTGAISAGAYIRVSYRSYRFGRGPNHSKLWCNY